MSVMSAPSSTRRRVLAGGLASLSGIPGACFAQDTGKVQQVSSTSLPVEGSFPSLSGATGWLNSAPLTAAGLRGRVVAVDFWTYTCVNWRRTLPYVHAWADKYKDQGLVVIGVHTPEFPFEHDVENIRREAKAMSIDYPIAIDSNYGVWRAFNNNYWPALYLIDASGRVRYHYFGEGKYETSERAIQQLLTEAGKSGFAQEPAAVEPRGVEVAADLNNLESPETYLGYRQAENFVALDGLSRDRARTYAAPARLAPNHWSIVGGWTIEAGAAVANEANGRVVYRFHARDVNMVLGSSPPGRPIRFRVTLDGAAPGSSHGADVDADGSGSVQAPRLYQLIRQDGAVADRTFEIEFFDPGVHAYVFTFG